MARVMQEQGSAGRLGEFQPGEPTSSISQMLCVLPRESVNAIPDEKARALMLDDEAVLAPSFQGGLSYDTRGEERKWKWTAIFPFASPHPGHTGHSGCRGR